MALEKAVLDLLLAYDRESLDREQRERVSAVVSAQRPTEPLSEWS